MEFYKITHPYYETDQEHDAANPIRMIEDTWLPGVICPICGETWAGSRRLYLPINDLELQQHLSGGPIPLSEWNELARKVHIALSLPDEFQLEPGDVLGTPIGELQSIEILDFLHPFPGQFIVQAHVIAALQQKKLTGFRLVPFKVSWSKKIKPPYPELPTLYELVVTGNAWRVDIGEEQIIACHACGRRKFPHPEWLRVDERRWDGSDFFNVDHNPNIVFVTERVCSTLSQYGFTNYDCIPIS
jgi:hypothetical protein